MLALGSSRISGPKCLDLVLRNSTWEVVAEGKLIWHSMLEVEHHESRPGSAPWEQSVSCSPSWVRLFGGLAGKKRV
jgi:hypothetical protein